MPRGAARCCLSAHLGSFDALRVLSLRNPDVPIRILLDVGQGAGLIRVLNALNPKLAATIIDARRPGPELVLEMQHALESNAVVSTLADRLRPGNPAIVANFLGDRGAVPGLAVAVRRARCACRWCWPSACIAAAIATTCISNASPSNCRAIAASAPRRWSTVVQRFADRLAHFARLAPYNWFNLYDFWDAALCTERSSWAHCC